ncbi:MAG TPA: CHAP domain-containing protein [Verrucomicrobiae bacterium]|nr:CHAP domain-containing protein [Verrucomicrobiae bacterium]
MKASRKASASLFALTLATGAGCTAQQPSESQQPTSTLPTSTSSASSEPATNGYSYGYGTYYVASRLNVPPNWGNAKTWYASAQASGYSTGDVPKKGAIAWTDRGPLGQVAIVEDVSADGTQVSISEMNGKDGWNRVTRRAALANSFKYIYPR